MLRNGIALLAAALFSCCAMSLAEEKAAIRGAVLKIGTVNWELTTLKNKGFDAENGFVLEVQPYADNGATRVALAAGEADFAVADWIWVARQNAEGSDYVFLPYSRAVGGLIVPEDSEIESLADLKGKKVGIAGGPVDKSWLILRAYSQQELGFDLADESEQVFGAPPLIMKAGFSGETDATINFWHFLAKMKAGGMREVISVAEAASALGLNPDTPLLGYVFKRNFLEADPERIEGFARASRQTKDLLASEEAVWEEIRDMMNAANDAQFEALKEGFRAGIPPEGPLDFQAASSLLSLMAELGGEQLVGKASELSKELFLTFD